MAESVESALKIPQYYLDKIMTAPDAKIVPSQERNIPTNFDLSTVPELDKDIIQSGLEDMAQYLGSPIITDGFEDHVQRRDWRIRILAETEMEKGLEAKEELNRIYSLNKLKRNAISRLYGYATLMDGIDPDRDYTNGHGPEIEKIVDEKVKQLSADEDPWEAASNAEKIATVGSLTQHIRAILDIYAKKD